MNFEIELIEDKHWVQFEIFEDVEDVDEFHELLRSIFRTIIFDLNQSLKNIEGFDYNNNIQFLSTISTEFLRIVSSNVNEKINSLSTSSKNEIIFDIGIDELYEKFIGAGKDIDNTISLSTQLLKFITEDKLLAQYELVKNFIHTVFKDNIKEYEIRFW